MTSEGLGEMFEGDSADTCSEKYLLVSMGPSRGSSVRRPVSEDPPSVVAEISFKAKIKTCRIINEILVYEFY